MPIFVCRLFFQFVESQIAYHSRKLAVNLKHLNPDKLALIINRKDVVSSSDDDLLSVDCSYRVHIGYDLFIYDSSIDEKLCLDTVAVGNPPIGAVLALNLHAFSDKTILIHDFLISWHRGGWRLEKCEIQYW